MDELAEARGCLARTIELLQRAHNQVPDTARPLMEAVLTSLEGCELTLGDVKRLLERQTER